MQRAGVGAGPYAKVLAKEIVKPGIEAVVMFRAVQDENVGRCKARH